MAPFSVLEQIENHRGVLTAKDLARILGVTPKAVYAQMKSGLIPVIVDGFSKKRVDPKSFAYVLRQRNPVMRTAAK